jgi:predicted O-linked N-acetylglucosamine transferase (SPINDLY family)
MDYRHFLEQLPYLYDNWKQNTVTPKSSDFAPILEQVGGLTTVNIMQLLNFAVGCLPAEEVYCQVGGLPSSTILGALHQHPQTLAYLVDDLTAIDPTGEKTAFLDQTLSKFGLENQVVFCNQTFEQFFTEYRALELPEKIGVFFYDGAADYRSILLALLLVKPFLAEKALIIIDDTNWTPAQQATWDFIQAHPQSHLALDLPTLRDGDPSFWNGLRVLTWDSNHSYNYDWQILQQFRNPEFINALTALPLTTEFARLTLQNIGSLTDYDPLSLYNYYGNPAKTEIEYKEKIVAEEQNISHYLDLSNVLMMQNKLDEAIATLEKAAAINYAHPDVHNNLAILYQRKGNQGMADLYYGHKHFYRQEYQVAIDHYQKFLQVYNGNEMLYKTLADCYNALGQYQAALQAYNTGLELYPHATQLHFWRIWALRDFGYLEESRVVADRAVELNPQAGQLIYQANLFLPIIYESLEEVDFIRDRYTKSLEKILQETDLETPEGRNTAWNSISWSTNFYLQYQGKNDIELQRAFGELMHKTLTHQYPQWVKEIPIPPLTKEKKIKVGYVSAYLRWHTVCKLFNGWMRHADKDHFEIYSYYVDVNADGMTEKVASYSDHFHHIPNDIPKLCQQIIEDGLHILVFLDIGMFPMINLVSALRLAPIQCMSWGHPITCGSPTMDYYLTSDLMEPEDAQAHYTEKLIRLPNISIAYEKPDISYATKTRADFGFPEDTILYLSCQSTFKYLPQYDYIFAEIALRVPKSKIVFITSSASQYITDKFKARLHRVFAQVGLDSEDYCIMAGRQDGVGYMSLNRVSDIFLDSVAWSGGNTTLEAIGCDLPVVTYPTEYMRGRHTYAILKMMGVEETIASTEAEYIEIAVRLGLDQEWRQSIVNKMINQQSVLYDDITPVKALEEFYRRTVQERLVNG